MAIDASTLPINPTMLLTAAAVAAFFAVGAGPEIARREIARSDWPTTCEAYVTADLEADRAPSQPIPQGTDCRSLISGFYPELRALCDAWGNPDPAAGIRDAERRAREAEDARIERAASQSGSRCQCAEILYFQTERVSLALYAASGRWLASPSIQHREAALLRALNAPACSFGRGD